MKLLSLCLLLFCLMVSCHYSIERENNYIDHLEAKNKCQKFILLVNEGKFDSAIAYTRDIDAQSLKNNTLKVDSLLGKMISYKYSNTESKITCKEKCNGKINVFFNIKRTKKDSKKAVYLEVIDDDLRIIGYDEKFDLE